MGNEKSVPKKYHKNRLTLQKVEDRLFNGGAQTTYYFVNRTPLKGMEKFVINYILNFTQNGKGCFTPYLKIAFAGGYKCQSIEPCISKLTKKGLIIKGNQINHKDNGGSHIDGGLWVDLNKLILLHKEYDDTNSFEKFEADYRIFQAEEQAKKQAKKDSKIREQAAEIEKLKQMLKQTQITANYTSTESGKVDRAGAGEEVVVSDITSTNKHLESRSGFRLTFDGEYVRTVDTLDDVMLWFRENGEKYLAKDAVELILYKESDSEGTCGLEMTYNGVYGNLLIEDLQYPSSQILSKSA